MDNLIGKNIANRYRVDSLLGQGGMGNVYKVWDIEIEKAQNHPRIRPSRINEDSPIRFVYSWP
jgi:serine/threonine protein kinase